MPRPRRCRSKALSSAPSHKQVSKATTNRSVRATKSTTKGGKARLQCLLSWRVKALDSNRNQQCKNRKLLFSQQAAMSCCIRLWQWVSVGRRCSSYHHNRSSFSKRCAQGLFSVEMAAEHRCLVSINRLKEGLELSALRVATWIVRGRKISVTVR